MMTRHQLMPLLMPLLTRLRMNLLTRQLMNLRMSQLTRLRMSQPMNLPQQAGCYESARLLTCSTLTHLR